MIGEQLRRAGFFTADFFKGRKVARHLKDIENKIEGGEDTTACLSDLLAYVIKNIPFYSGIEKNELQYFPVIKKSDIVKRYGDFENSAYRKSKLHWVSTSGSSGTPFHASQNAEKRDRTIADLIYFHRKNGWKLGERYIFLRAWTTSYYHVPKLKMFLQNFLMANVIRFDDEAKEKMRQKLKKDKNIKVILGYASGLESFVNYLEAKGDSADMFSVKVIFADSDTLKETVKSKLEAIFGCPVVDRYSNEEQGLMACTNAHNPGFILNTASYHFELLKLDKDEQARPGEIGRLVVTDLYNRSMPFIRYDTGDLGVSYDTGSLKTLSELHGRVADALQDTKGSMVSASLVNNFFHHLYKIKQYQLIQNGEKNYELKVVCEKDDYAESELINTCRAFLGEEASVAVRYAFRIPAEENGKFKTTVSRYGHKSKTEDLCAR